MTFDLDHVRKARATVAGPMVARIGGRDIRFHPNAPLVPTKTAADQITAAEGSTDPLALTVAVLNYLQVVVHPDSADDFAEVILSTDDPIGAEDISDLYLWVCGEYVRRSTPPPEDLKLPAPATPPQRPTPAARRTSLEELSAITSRPIKGGKVGQIVTDG